MKDFYTISQRGVGFLSRNLGSLIWFYLNRLIRPSPLRFTALKNSIEASYMTLCMLVGESSMFQIIQIYTIPTRSHRHIPLRLDHSIKIVWGTPLARPLLLVQPPETVRLL